MAGNKQDERYDLLLIIKFTDYYFQVSKSNHQFIGNTGDRATMVNSFFYVKDKYIK